MVIDRETVRRLAEQLETRLRRLANLAAVSEDQYLADESLQDRAERNIEVAAQFAIDIGQHLLAGMGGPTPASYREVFTLLAREGVIPHDLAEGLAMMAGFRNVLADGYVALDQRRVYRALHTTGDLRTFVERVFKYME